MSHFKKSILFILSLLLLPIVIGATGCTSGQKGAVTPETSGEGFAIYLTREDIPPARMPALSHFDVAGTPVIGINDIMSYNEQTYELKLTLDAFARICKLEVPVEGRSFVVCVDKKIIYWGAFWTPISSLSFDGVTIWKPWEIQEPFIVTLQLGYPTASFYGGEDPRNSPEVIKSLGEAGKLIPRLSLIAVTTLPHAMKGYELYSWLEGSEWHFTLITGTNRNKTTEEIISKDNFIAEAGWVKIQVAGVTAIKQVLAKLPENEPVFWLAGMRTGPSGQSEVIITLPPAPVVDAIKEYASGCDLDFSVQSP